MMSLYQAYFAITLSLMVLTLMQSILKNEKEPAEVIRAGIDYLAFLAVTVVIYSLIQKWMLSGSGLEGLYEDIMSSKSLTLLQMLKSFPQNAADAYSHFLIGMMGLEFGLVQSNWSALYHGLCALLCVFLLIRSLKKCCKVGNRVLQLILFALLPLCINCLYVLVQKESLHTLTQYSFIATYILAAMLVDAQPRRGFGAMTQDFVAICLALILGINTFAANKTYLRTHLEYESTYAMYSGIMTQIEMTPGFEEGDKIALIGYAEDSDELRRFNRRAVTGSESYRNAYSRNDFFRYYLGMNLEFATEEEVQELAADPRVQSMNVYPYYGFVQKINNFMVVKLGETQGS